MVFSYKIAYRLINAFWRIAKRFLAHSLIISLSFPKILAALQSHKIIKQKFLRFFAYFYIIMELNIGQVLLFTIADDIDDFRQVL